jgi:glycosyltransferase involved in cell wall biosynthesis
VTRYFPACTPSVIPHGVPALDAAPRSATPIAVLLPDDGWRTIAVLGAIGPDKGSRRLERLVDLARARGLPLRFVLIGYLDRQRGPWQSDDARFVVHGRYEPGDLPRLLAHYRAELVLFPSAGPETFAYTLSEAWLCGLPALVPPIGALAERVAQAEAGWVMSEREWTEEGAMLDRVVDLLAAENRAVFDAARRSTREVGAHALDDMAAATVAHYAAAVLEPRSRAAGFEPARVRDAAGYRSWYPAVDAQPAAIARQRAAPSVVASVARAALRVRHTALGRLAYRLAPGRMISALRSHLR